MIKIYRNCQVLKLYQRSWFQFYQKANVQDISIETEEDKVESERSKIFSSQNYSDFQQQFGLMDDLLELKVSNQQKENKQVAMYSLGCGILLVCATVGLLYFLNPQCERYFLRNYYTYSCYFKLKQYNCFNTRDSCKYKVKIIGQYLHNLEKINVKQPKFNLYLLEQIKNILLRPNLKDKNDIQNQANQIIQRIFTIQASSEKYSQYYEEFNNIIFELTQKSDIKLTNSNQIFNYSISQNSNLMQIQFFLDSILKENIKFENNEDIRKFLDNGVEKMNNYLNLKNEELKQEYSWRQFALFRNEFELKIIRKILNSYVEIIQKHQKTDIEDICQKYNELIQKVF